MINLLLVGLLMGGPAPRSASFAGAATATPTEAALYRQIGLQGVLDEKVFAAAYDRVQREGRSARMLAIADMSQPSTERRFYVIDLEEGKLLLRTLVAHGSGSGDLMAERFSNRDRSHATSLGLYRVGARIVSPKHGPALLLDGLDRNVNDNARSREVIIHAASYVSPAYAASHGRLGRSWGCPAVPAADMPKLIELLRDGGLLYVYGA